ncbi:hypothetical protein BC835DRAFT_1329412 [Cytidiella melzeri]|nr:hypothetical protein BC835DRAFT_1329412 [Cytidiella melzeri]
MRLSTSLILAVISGAFYMLTVSASPYSGGGSCFSTSSVHKSEFPKHQARGIFPPTRKTTLDQKMLVIQLRLHKEGRLDRLKEMVQKDIRDAKIKPGDICKGPSRNFEENNNGHRYTEDEVKSVYWLVSKDPFYRDGVYLQSIDI